MPRRGGGSLRVKGMKGLEVALDPIKFARASRASIRRATQLNGKLAEAEMRKQIQKGVNPRNSDLSQAIKGGDKPLVDSSELFNAITSVVQSDTEVFVGVTRKSGAYNVAAIVHEGATIRVTPAMRGMFFFLWKASVGEMDPSKLTGRAAELFQRFQDWRPLAASTTVIVIPARPFVELTFDSPRLKGIARYNWERALGTAFKRRANEGRSKK